MKKQRIGLMGGTFDPVHYGHLVTAETAREAYALDEVVFIPSGRPPHKQLGNVSDFWHRYLMVLLAISSQPFFRVSKTEYEREGPSYTVDTIRDFRRSHQAEIDLFFITGADAILEIMHWKQSKELLASCRFIAATRPGYNLRRIKTLLGKQFLEVISLLEVPLLSISSSDLRERVKKNCSIKYLVPEPVETYIYHNDLYRG